jgi:Zn-dependent protease
MNDLPEQPLAPPQPDQPSDWDEELYQAATQLLVEPPRAGSTWASLGCLTISAGLFVLSFLNMPPQDLVCLVAVVFFHEVGHWVGMRLFGYRNVKMFFIPFFGAAVSGSKHAAPAWQQCVVLLLGPLPGIALALLLQLAFAPPYNSWQGQAVFILAIFNGINLVPLVPLDGGRLLDILLFARRPWLALAFRLFAVAGLGLAAYQFGSYYQFESYILGALALALLLGAPMRYRRAQLERAFAGNPLALPDRLEDLSDAERRDLFDRARRIEYTRRNPTLIAGEMRLLHEHMVTRRPGALAWSLLLGLYLAGIAGSVAAPVLAVQQHRAEQARAAAG